MTITMTTTQAAQIEWDGKQAAIEASQLGWAPGEWPADIILTVDGRTFRFQKYQPLSRLGLTYKQQTKIVRKAFQG